MTANIYHDEAIIRSVTYSTRGGHKVSFELDPEGWERLKGMETTRCMMVLVPIQNDGMPDPDVKPAEKPRKRMAELSRAQQAGILCNDERFIAFLSQHYDMDVNTRNPIAEDAASFVRAFCKVDSRAELDNSEHGHERWDQLRTEYDAWAGKIGWPEPARAGA